MATMAVRQARVRPDDIFFPAMALLMLGIVFAGFAKTYFLAGMMAAKLPNVLVHVHGAVFVLWILLVVAQTSLVTVHRVKWHMKLGGLSVLVLPAMCILGVLTLFDFIRRAQPEEGPEVLRVGDLEILTLFLSLTVWGLLARRDGASHKRLMILGTMAIMGPAVARWNFGVSATLGILLGLPFVVLAYDLWLLKRVHRTTAVAVAANSAWVLTVLPFSKLAFWHHCVEWIRHS